MRVVIDCNVLVSAGRSRGTCAEVIIEVVRDHEVVLSGPIVDEYKGIAGRSAHASYRDRLLASARQKTPDFAVGTAPSQHSPMLANAKSIRNLIANASIGVKPSKLP